MPRDFRFLDLTPPFDVIVAVRLDPARQAIGGFDYHALARLKPGVTPEEASADIERMLPIWLDAWPMLPGFSATREAIENWRITPVVRPLKDDIVGGVASALWVLMGAIGAVLLVACANIANLMLVRADARRQELAMRAALGAVPARIARELLVESLVLGAIGGALGLLLAYGGLELLVAIGPSTCRGSRRSPCIRPCSRSPWPCRSRRRSCSARSRRSSTRCASMRPRHRRGAARARAASATRRATRLVVVQVALALVLVVSAVLMIRTFQALRDVDPGFAEPASIQTVRTWAPTPDRVIRGSSCACSTRFSTRSPRCRV